MRRVRACCIVLLGTLFTVISGWLQAGPVAGEKKVRICIDESFWYPFTMVDPHGQATGIHVDMARAAFRDLGITPVFVPMPWKRCLQENATGRIDAVVSASYKPDRAEYLDYPEDASTSKSAFRIMQIEYVVVTLKKDGYEFNGDIRTIPQPIRIPAGYSVASDLRKAGLLIEDSSQTDTANVQKLLRDGKGSVIIIPELASFLQHSPEYNGKLQISPVPISSKSYFIAFSKKGVLTDTEKSRIWQRIAQIRNNNALLQQFRAKYQKVD